MAPVAAAPQVTVIPGVDSLIGDLLDMDIGPPMTQQYHQSMGPPVGAVPSAGAMDLLGEGLDSLVSYIIFTALHEMQMQSYDENSVYPSVCPSNAWIVTKRKKI